MAEEQNRQGEIHQEEPVWDETDSEEVTEEEPTDTIDGVYERFVKGVVRAVGSTDFYQFFMDAVSRAENSFQFSNRKLIKTVDLEWVDAIEETLPAFQNILASPRNMIKEEELIVNVANARKADSETVRHLAQHGALVEDYDVRSGEVRPGRLMQRYREDTIGLYENRLVFTTMEIAHHFVKIRHDALFEAMSDEFGAKLKVQSDMNSATEHVHMDSYVHIKEIDSALETDKKNRDVFSDISRIYRVLTVFMNSPFAAKMAKQARIKGTVTKTNVLKRNKDYSQVLKLFEFLREYDDVGYTIQVVEQNPVVNERLQQDIYHNLLFQYLVVKGYLEDEADRKKPRKQKGRQRSLKPKIIREIIEELTEDYDLPDVEIRKVLIEELTKEQLMQEEASERLRLVEEQEQRRQAQKEQEIREEEARQKEIEKEQEAKEERLRLEKEEQERMRRQKIMERNIEDRRRSKIFRAQLEWFRAHLEEYRELREEQNNEDAEPVTDYEDLVSQMERAEAKEKEERAALHRQKLEERQREEARRQAVARAEQRKRDLEVLEPYMAELSRFAKYREAQKQLRLHQAELIRQKRQERENSRQQRMQKKNRRQV